VIAKLGSLTQGC